MSEVWGTAREPSLDELFAEPIVQMLMQRDGVHARDMQHQLHRIAGREIPRQKRF